MDCLRAPRSAWPQPLSVGTYPHATTCRRTRQTRVASLGLSWAIGEPRPTSALRAGFREPSWSHCHDCRTLRAPIWKTHRRTERFLRWLHFDSCCSANAHSRSGSRWPAFANSIVSFATAVVAGHCDQQVRVCPRRLRMRRHIAISSGSND